MSRFTHYLAATSIAWSMVAFMATTAQSQNLTLFVDPFSGTISIQNRTLVTASLDGYQIDSPSGRLLPDPTHTQGVGWDSLINSGLPNWEEVAPTANSLTELNLNSSTSIPFGGSLNLGKALTPGATPNLTFRYSRPNGTLVNPAPIIFNPGLVLDVDQFSGVAMIRNTSTGPLSLDGYQIDSPSGRLLPDPTHTQGVGWDSLSNSGVPNWEEVAPTVNSLTELNLNSSTSIPAGGSLSLGKAITQFQAADVAFQWTQPDGTLRAPGVVNQVGGLQVVVNVLLSNHGSTIEDTKAVLTNTSSTALTTDAYTLSSASGSLNPAGFSGFAGHGVSGWESVAPSATLLTELNLSSSTTMTGNSRQVLGTVYTIGTPNDLTFTWNLVGQGLFSNPVLYQAVLAGDANADKIVNIFDINLISSNWNTAGPNGDVNYDGIVNIFDINYVSSHWANTLSGGAATAVPEPSSWVLLSLGSLAARVRCAARGQRKKLTTPRGRHHDV